MVATKKIPIKHIQKEMRKKSYYYKKSTKQKEMWQMKKKNKIATRHTDKMAIVVLLYQ